jgi:hypothetical protein
MITQLMVAALTLGALPQADTVIRVEAGTRLDVDNFRGEVVVRSWGRDEVQVEAEMDGRDVLDVVRTGSVLRVRPRRTGGGDDADIQISVPRWMDVRVEGNQVDVEISGTRGEISVETIGGDVSVEGGVGLISLRSIQGEIHLRGARGRVEAVSVNEEVSLEDVEGDIYVETTNGDISLENVRSESTRATTVNGDITYDGSIRGNGHYVFATHNGDLTVTVPENANATVSVSTYHGEFESDFPVRLTGTTRDRQFNFTLGSGSARIELESFNGEIMLRRP